MMLIEFLEQKRQELGLSKRAFARHMGVDPAEYFNWFTGKRTLGRAGAIRIRKAFPDLWQAVEAHIDWLERHRGARHKKQEAG